MLVTPPCRNRSFPVTPTSQPRTHAMLGAASVLLLLLSTLHHPLNSLPTPPSTIPSSSCTLLSTRTHATLSTAGELLLLLCTVH